MDWTATIPKVEQLLNSENFDADDIADALTADALEFRYMALTSLTSYQSGGSSVRLVFVSPSIYQYWANDVELVDDNYDVVIPDNVDYVNGRVTFAADQSDGILATGYSADIYAAAARLLDSRAAELSEDLQSFSTQNGSFTYAARSGALQKQAALYRNRTRIIGDTHGLQRVDVNIF